MPILTMLKLPVPLSSIGDIYSYVRQILYSGGRNSRHCFFCKKILTKTKYGHTVKQLLLRAYNAEDILTKFLLPVICSAVQV